MKRESYVVICVENNVSPYRKITTGIVAIQNVDLNSFPANLFSILHTENRLAVV